MKMENQQYNQPADIPRHKEVPEGREVKKVRQHFRLRSEKVSEADYPPLSVAKIGVVPQLADVAISMAQGETRKLVRKGDYVVNSRSDRKGSCGLAPQDGSVTTISIVLEPRNIDQQFVHYLFRSTPWVEEFYRNGRGIVADLWTTRYQEMRNMPFPLPPLPEQREIVAYLDERCGQVGGRGGGAQGIQAAPDRRCGNRPAEGGVMRRLGQLGRLRRGGGQVGGRGGGAQGIQAAPD
ncbi:MAG: restriction endonuclease subunit S, partial [Kiritimatiellia bacterium]